MASGAKDFKRQRKTLIKKAVFESVDTYTGLKLQNFN